MDNLLNFINSNLDLNNDPFINAIILGIIFIVIFDFYSILFSAIFSFFKK